MPRMMALKQPKRRAGNRQFQWFQCLKNLMTSYEAEKPWTLICCQKSGEGFFNSTLFSRWLKGQFTEFTFLFGVKARAARVSMNFLSTHRWWRQEYYGRIAYCIPILAFASCIYDVSTRQTPEMVQQAQWASWLIYHGILFLVGKPSILTYSLHILMSQSWPCWRRVALVPWEGHRISDMRQQVADMFVSENRLPPNLIRTDSIIIFPYFPIFSHIFPLKLFEWP